MERLLGILNGYRKKSLTLEEEHEAIVNVLDSLCSLLLVDECSEHFRRLQGFELLMILCKKQSELRRHVIKVFDYALTQHELPSSAKNGRYFVEKGGLPIVFGVFMQSAKKKKGDLVIKLTKEDQQEDEQHVLNILVGLLISTEGLIHERVLFKFIENTFEKLQRLFELHIKLWQPLAEFELDKFEAPEEVQYLAEDYGLDRIERADLLIGLLQTSQEAEKLSEGDSITGKIKEFMKFNGVSFQQIKQVLRLGLVRADEESLYTKAVLRVYEQLP